MHRGGLLICDTRSKAPPKKNDPNNTEGYPVVQPAASRCYSPNTSLDHGAPAIAKYKLVIGP